MMLFNVAKLKELARYYPEGFLDFLLTHGRIEGDNVAANSLALRKLHTKYPRPWRVAFNVAQLKKHAWRYPKGYVDCVFAHGEIEGDVVVLDERDLKQTDEFFPRSKYPDLGMFIEIEALKQDKERLPDGYLDYVLALGKVDDGALVLNGEILAQVQQKFPIVKLGNYKLVKYTIMCGLPARLKHENALRNAPPSEISAQPVIDRLPLVANPQSSTHLELARASHTPRGIVASSNLRTKKIVVYTAILDGQGPLPPPPTELFPLATFVVFQNGRTIMPGWESRPLCGKFSDPARNMLRHKVLPHVYFLKAEYSLWMDSILLFKPKFDLRGWIAKYLDGHDVAVFRHPLRDCCYQEAVECIQRRLDDPVLIDRQLESYSRKGYPVRHGLADSSILLRRHNKKTQRFNQIWHRQIKTYSKLDQLSLNYALREAKIRLKYISGLVLENNYFSRQFQGGMKSPRQRALPSVSAVIEKPDVIILSHPRSGTHFLQASLASHPKVHVRDEFMRIYARTGLDELKNLINFKGRIYANTPRRLNIGIIMYQDVPEFEKRFGPLYQAKIIHLVRDPRRVARSFAQMWADLILNKVDYQYHTNLEQSPRPKAPLTATHVSDAITLVQTCATILKITDIAAKTKTSGHKPTDPNNDIESNLDILQAAIAALQRHFSSLLATHPNIFLVDYDEITHNSQTNVLPEKFSHEILGFLGLNFQPLSNDLRKTGQG